MKPQQLKIKDKMDHQPEEAEEEVKSKISKMAVPTSEEVDPEVEEEPMTAKETLEALEAWKEEPIEEIEEI